MVAVAYYISACSLRHSITMEYDAGGLCSDLMASLVSMQLLSLLLRMLPSFPRCVFFSLRFEGICSC